MPHEHRRHGFFVVDVDPRCGGTESLAEAEAAEGPLPATLEAITADGCRHVYMNRQPGVADSFGRPLPLEKRREPPGLFVKVGAQYARHFESAPGLFFHDSGEPSTWTIYEEAQRLARAWSSPHDAPSTAGNFEVMAMNAIHFHAGLMQLLEARHLSREDWVVVASQMSEQFERVCETVDRFWASYAVDADERPIGLRTFLEGWHVSGFARLEVGHKLAAALCCTDVPAELEPRAPWLAWSLIVPDGLFSPWGISRLWCIGPKWAITVVNEGFALRAPQPDDAAEAAYAHGGDAIAVMIRNLIRGACLSISNPDEHRKKGAHGGHSSKRQRHGPPDLAQARFILTAPVSIDLRDHVAGVSSGRTSAAPKVQFLVRGHWREQAHGAARALRKRIWIQPFWKGPEGSRVLLRSHTLKSED